MNSKKEIPLQVAKIQRIFQAAKDFCTEQNDLATLITYLENTDREFRSIAYEGASMAVALKDLEKGDTLNLWNSFAEHSEINHTPQLYVGLGWALAQENSDPLPYLKTLIPLMRFRVLDGCGYYDGIFRQRSTIKNYKIPENFKEQLLQNYDQGVGRSLWYTLKGDQQKITATINTFSSDRQSALWRGIGVACTYVGGCDENQLRSLLSGSGNYYIQLATGAVLVSRSRIQANTLTADAELACKTWCHLSAEEAFLLSVRSEPDSSVDADSAYKLWISQIETELIATLTIKR